MDAPSCGRPCSRPPHRGQQEYCEECPDQRRLVRRDPALRDNDALPAAFQRAAGDLLYSSMRDGFTVDGRVRLGVLHLRIREC